MKKIFRKAMTVLGSAALVGMTIGAAAAASYPSPFTSNTAIVVGASAAPSDNIAAASIASNLDAASAGTVSGGTVTSIEGDVISLDTSSTRIWLNTSLDTAKSTITKTDLPVVLGDYTFSGNVDAKLTSTITIGPGAAGDSAAVGSSKVIFAKQPKTSTDPVIGISLGAKAAALYNATFTSKAIAINHTDSEGENIRLFGRDFVVSTATDTDSIILFSSAEEVTLTAGGTSPSPTASVVIDGASYEIELVTGDSSEATIAVNGESKSVSEGASKKINGVDVAVKSTTESTALDTLTATILVGSEKITFEDGTSVMVGSDDDPVDGTTAYITGGPGALTKLVVQVYRPTTSEDVILAGTSFTDPVFGSFKIDFAGLDSPLDSSDREEIIVDSSGDDSMTLTMTDDNANTATFDFTHNASSQTFLGDDSNYTIAVIEMANLTESEYVVVGSEEYGHLVQVTQIYNNTGTDYTNDKVKFQDVFSDEIYTATFTSEGTGSVPIDGKTYDVTFVGTGDDGSTQIKYPTSDSADADTFVVYPTIKTSNGNQVALYEPLTLTLGNIDGAGVSTSTTLNFPDGDDYTWIKFATVGGAGNWTITGATTGVLNTGAVAAGDTHKSFAVGELTYNITSTVIDGSNVTKLYVTNPEDSSTNIDNPGLIIFEGKDDSSNYEAIVVNLEGNAAGTSTSAIGVDTVLFSSPTHFNGITMQSDSDIVQDVDWYGTLASLDNNVAGQKKLTLSMPATQVFAQVYLGETSAVISGGAATSAGVMTVMDTAVASVAGKNLVVVGGSAINSVAAELLGAAYRGEAFTSATDVAAGEFLIQSFARSGKTAMLVAGYNAADTEKAVTYLLNNDVDTTIGVKMKGTSATEATLVTA